jgi:hypothetical protein
VHFLSTLKGELLITLIYNNNLLSLEWEEEGKRLISLLQQELNICNTNNNNNTNNANYIGLIGRSKGIMKSLDGRNYVEEELELFGKKLYYRQVEGMTNYKEEIVFSIRILKMVSHLS